MHIQKGQSLGPAGRGGGGGNDRAFPPPPQEEGGMTGHSPLPPRRRGE